MPLCTMSISSAAVAVAPESTPVRNFAITGSSADMATTAGDDGTCAPTDPVLDTSALLAAAALIALGVAVPDVIVLVSPSCARSGGRVRFVRASLTIARGDALRLGLSLPPDLGLRV